MRANASSRHAKDKLSIGVQIKTPKPNKGEKKRGGQQITPNKHAKRQGSERLGIFIIFFSRQPESDDSVAPVEEELWDARDVGDSPRSW